MLPCKRRRLHESQFNICQKPWLANCTINYNDTTSVQCDRVALCKNSRIIDSDFKKQYDKAEDDFSPLFTVNAAELRLPELISFLDIIHGNCELSDSNVFRVIKAASHFKATQLLEECDKLIFRMDKVFTQPQMDILADCMPTTLYNIWKSNTDRLYEQVATSTSFKPSVRLWIQNTLQQDNADAQKWRQYSTDFLKLLLFAKADQYHDMKCLSRENRQDYINLIDKLLEDFDIQDVSDAFREQSIVLEELFTDSSPL